MNTNGAAPKLRRVLAALAVVVAFTPAVQAYQGMLVRPLQVVG